MELQEVDGGGRTAGGWLAGAATGFAAALVNMLILGSLLPSSPTAFATPSTMLWIPGSRVLISLGFDAFTQG